MSPMLPLCYSQQGTCLPRSTGLVPRAHCQTSSQADRPSLIASTVERLATFALARQNISHEFGIGSDHGLRYDVPVTNLATSLRRSEVIPAVPGALWVDMWISARLHGNDPLVACATWTLFNNFMSFTTPLCPANVCHRITASASLKLHGFVIATSRERIRPVGHHPFLSSASPDSRVIAKLCHPHRDNKLW